MSTLHEQARAEAEKRFPDTNPLALALAMRDVFQQGFLAGHEAASRPRQVTTEEVFAAIDIALSDRCDQSAATRELGRCGCPEDSTLRLIAERVMALYVPEE